MSNTNPKQWKEFCSSCNTYYTMENGIWEPCPNCDGMGNKQANACSCNDEETVYVEVRQRWNIN